MYDNQPTFYMNGRCSTSTFQGLLPQLHRIYSLLWSKHPRPTLRLAEKGIRAEIWHATEGAEYIADIIGWFDPLVIGRGPILDDAFDDGNAGQSQVCETGQEATSVGVEEELVRREARGRAIKVRRRPHHDDAAEIHDAGFGAAEKGFEDGAVFLCGGAVMSGAVREKADVFFEAGGQDGTGVEDVAGGAIAGNEFGRLVCRCVRILLAKSYRGGGVLQLHILGKGYGL